MSRDLAGIKEILQKKIQKPSKIPDIGYCLVDKLALSLSYLGDCPIFMLNFYNDFMKKTNNQTIKRWINKLWILMLNAFNGWFGSGDFAPNGSSGSNYNNGLKMITGLR